MKNSFLNTMMKLKSVSSRQRHTIRLLCRYATGLWLIGLILLSAVFSTKAAELTKRYSMLKNRIKTFLLYKNQDNNLCICRYIIL